MKNLKNLTATVLLLLGTTSIVNAQERIATSGSSTKFGIKGGVNFSNLYTEDVTDENVLTGFHLGAFVELPLTAAISLQPEVAYSTKGAENEYDNATASGRVKFRLNYIEVPVLLKFNITNRFNIHAGPYVAFLVDSKITDEDNDGSVNFENEVDEDNLNNVDFGLAAGLGIDFGNLGIGARYNYGLTTVGKEQSFLGTTYTFPDGKNSVLGLFATLKF
jgi:hypothetical protein